MAKTAGNIWILWAVSIGLMATFATSHADTYRWVDDNGIVNYAERVPRDVPAERITKVTSGESKRPASKPAPAPSDTPVASRPSSSGVPLNANQEEIMRDLKQVEAAREAQMAKIREDNCVRSRRVLTNLTASPRIRVRGEDGAERIIGEDERLSRIEDAQRGIAENCAS